MSLESIAKRHIERIESFLDDDDQTLLAVRTAEGGESIGARLLARIERLEERSLAMIALANAFESESAFFAKAAKTVAADIQTAEQDLAAVGLGLGDVEPYPAPPAEAPLGAAAMAFADWLERLERRLAPRISQLVVLIAPSEVTDRTELAATLTALAAATASPAIKYLVLDRADDPLLAAAEIPRPRAAWAPELPEQPRSRHAFSHAARRVIAVPKQGSHAWAPARLRAALGPGLLVELAAPLHDRWSLFADLEDAAAAAASGLANGEPLPRPATPPRAAVEARFAEYMESLAALSGGVALVCIDVTASGSPELAADVFRRLAQAASSERVRYLLRIDSKEAIAKLSPARIATHEIRFEPEMIAEGYEKMVADPDLPAAERVRALCMLSGFVAARPKRFSGASKKRAVELARQAAESSQALESPHDRAMALLTLGNALLMDDQGPPAREAYALATKVALDAGSLPLAAHALGQVGVIHARMGEYATAATSLRAAAQAFQKAAHPLGEAQILLWLGDVETRRDDHAAAVRAWEDVIGRAERMQAYAGEGAQGFAAQAHERLAAAFERGESATRAREHREQARSLGSKGVIMEAF